MGRWFRGIHDVGDLALIRDDRWWVCGVATAFEAGTITVAWGDTCRTVKDEPARIMFVRERERLHRSAGQFIGQRFRSLAAAVRSFAPHCRDAATYTG